jgi:hypothetical protein
MMRLGRTASLLVAFSLLTSTATAYAECAWVLWQGTSSAWTGQPVDNSPMRVESAMPDYSSCMDSARRIAPRYITSWTGDQNPRVEELSNGFVATGQSDKVRMSTAYQCFPETVDPRPKEK